MKITELAYSRSQTMQLRQYEPTNIFMSAKAEVGIGDDTSIVFAELKALVDRELALKTKMLQEPQRVARAGAKEVIARDNKKYSSGGMTNQDDPGF